MFGTLVVFDRIFKEVDFGEKSVGDTKYKITQYAKSLNTLWTLGSAMRDVVNFKENLKAKCPVKLYSSIIMEPGPWCHYSN